MSDMESSTTRAAGTILPACSAKADNIERRLGDLGDGIARRGRVTALGGQVIRAAVPDAELGELCHVRRRAGGTLVAEVVGFDRQDAILMPLERLDGISANAAVEPVGHATKFPAGPGVRGRVLDGLGRPVDGLGPLRDITRVPLAAPPPDPLQRQPVDQVVVTGVRAMDGILTVGRGQRVGIFAEAGGGKSTLLGMIARHISADRVVVALIGERGREVAPFLQRDLGAQGLGRCTVVVSTSDQPAMLRLRAAYAATAIAEEARRRGEHVVLMMDSVTRFARALRDAGLAAGEPPGRQGYPASMAQVLPQLFERAGNDEHGFMTAFYTVLVEGGDMQEPVAHETRSLLDGHIVLSGRVPHFPRIDIVASESRVRDDLIEHREAARAARRIVLTHRENHDKITMELYKEGASEEIDDAIARIKPLNAFLSQTRDEPPSPYDQTVSRLREVTGET